MSFEDELNVMSVSKRKSIWEPIFIGTKNDPPYDERLSWEGKRDKMTQAYLFCLLGKRFITRYTIYGIHFLCKYMFFHYRLQFCDPGQRLPDT